MSTRPWRPRAKADDKSLLIRALVARGCVVIYEADAAAPYFAEAARLARDLGDSWRLSRILERQSYGAMFVTGDLHGVRVGSERRTRARTTNRRPIDRPSMRHIHRGRALRARVTFDRLLAQARSRHDRGQGYARSPVRNDGPDVRIDHAWRFQGRLASGAQRAIAAALDGAPEIGELLRERLLPQSRLGVTWPPATSRRHGRHANVRSRPSRTCTTL